MSQSFVDEYNAINLLIPQVKKLLGEKPDTSKVYSTKDLETIRAVAAK